MPPEGLSLQPALMSAAAKLADAGKAPPDAIYQLTPGHRHSFTRVFSALLSEPSEVRWIDRVPDNPEPVDVVFLPDAGLRACRRHFWMQ